MVFIFCNIIQYNMGDIEVSVVCQVYNHEKYLRRCLEGFVTQETSFNYEVIVYDDASTDKSKKIIEEYVAKYPNIIKPIYQKENMYSNPEVWIAVDLIFPKTSGKYIALCEGDDYWIDKHKLQQQYTAMEKNPNCSMSVHKVNGVDKFEQNIGKVFPNNEVRSGVLENSKMIRSIIEDDSYPFHTSSFFVRSSYIKLLCNGGTPIFMSYTNSGDMCYLLFMLTKGNIYYIEKIMSCYRMVSEGSWSERMNNDINYQITHQKGFLKFLNAFDLYTGKKFHDSIQKDIHRRKFRILKTEFKYNAMRKKEYRKEYSRLTKKEILYYRIGYSFPKMQKKLRDIKILYINRKSR